MVSTVVPRQLSATAFAMLFSPNKGALTAALSLLMGQAVRITDTTSVDSSHRPAFEPTDDEMRTLMGAMPHAQVATSMKTRFHQNPEHLWTANHVTDIDAMSTAFVYCDVVFTDKEARNALLESRELRPLSTFVPHRADELAEWLDALPVVVAPEMLVPHPLRRPLS